MLNEAEEFCIAALRAAKVAAAAANGEDADGPPAAANEGVALAEAVLCRIRYRRGFCLALLRA